MSPSRPGTPARRRSPEILALAGLFVGAAVMLAIGVIFPMTEHAPVATGVVLIGVSLALAIGTVAFGDRLPRAVLPAEAVVAAGLNSYLLSLSHTPVGAMTTGIAFVWMTVYVAVFFPRFAMAYAAIVGALFGGALLEAGLPGMFSPWMLATLTGFMLAAVLSSFSRTMHRHLRTDELTGTLNRGGLQEEAQRAALRARRQAREIAVAAIDLDDFKQVNDREGHLAGDRLLAGAAQAWFGELREGDVLARTGGDEFVLVMPGTTAEQAGAMLDRLRESHPVGFSAGVATWDGEEPLEACLERADRSLYAAKAAR